MKRIIEVEKCANKYCPFYEIAQVYEKLIHVCRNPDTTFGYLYGQEFEDTFPINCPLKKKEQKCTK